MTTTKQSLLKRTACALAVTSALAMSAPTLAADAFNGTVKGVIKAGEQVAAGATITLVHKGKGIKRTIQADADGSYSLSKLPVGTYTMTISKPGYDDIVESDLVVKVGTSIVYNGFLLTEGQDLERIQVTGSRISRVDMESSTGGIIVTAAELQDMPVESGFESIALLTPGVSANDEFNSASIGGSSSAENAFYLNGINITEIKTGIGSIALPWEAIAQTEIKTGGIDPEFGGALGGIVNAVSKSGSNEFEFGGYLRVDPEATRSHHDNLLLKDGETIFTVSEGDESTFTRASIWASGAIVEDELFFYALYAPQNNDYTAAKATTIEYAEEKSDRYFGKLDWFMNDDHSLEFTAIGYTKKGKGTDYNYDWKTEEVGELNGPIKWRSGGDIYGLKYSGILNDDMSVEVIAGRTVDKTYNSAVSDEPRVWSKLSGEWVKVSSESDASITESEFIRDQFRADFNWTLDDHNIKIGFDYVNIDVDYQDRPNGVADRIGWWDVYDAATANHDSGLPEGTPYVQQRIRTDYTDSEVTSSAFYIQDTWNVTDQLVLNLGVRYSNVSNTLSDGRKYVDVKGQIAPRLQAIYDLNGDGETKLFATFGRYFQPVSANMNITQGGARRDEYRWYRLGDTSNGEIVLLPDGSPSTGEYVGGRLIENAQNPDVIASKNMESMYSDEITAGFQQELMDGDMVLGVRAIYRDLKRSIEDTNYGPVINKYLADNGIAGNADWTYVLANPGSALDISHDFDGDGVAEDIYIPGSEVGLPKASRTYAALETTLSGVYADDFRYNASYTWSHSWGNTEGLVRTDNGQADPGWTTSYDAADFMDHGYGNLPNDRRHAFKLSGAYDITDELTLGLNTRFTSGMPVNKFSWHPGDVDSCAEGNVWNECISLYYSSPYAFYDEDGNPAPRGSQGRTKWLNEVDMSVAYKTQVGDGDLLLKATIYNLFDADTQTAIKEETGANWRSTTGRLGARYMSFEARYSF